jgi:hypothetical protein
MPVEFDYEQLLGTVADYMAERVSEIPLADMGYTRFGHVGLMPPLSNRTDFKEFPNAYYPFLGASPQVIQYFDGTLGRFYPKKGIQISYGSRTPGIQPAVDTGAMLKIVKNMESIIVQAAETTIFGLQTVIRSVTLVDCLMYPSFYASVGGDRKYYQIAVFSLRLDLEGI